MSRGVEPKKVAPLIKGARYSFLIAGWFYGVNKKAIISRIEAIAAPKRKAALEEEKKLKIIQGKERSIQDFEKLFKEIDYTPEPGWKKMF